MVEFEEIEGVEPVTNGLGHTTAASSPSNDEVPPSQERLLDAECIEKAAAQMDRPTARMHLESLAKKLRREAQALKVMEASRSKAEEAAAASPKKADATTDAPSPAPAITTPTPAAVDVDVTTSEPMPPPPESPTATVTATPPPTPATPTPSPAAASTATATPAPSAPPGGLYTPVDRFSFDAGGYDSGFVTLYVPLVGVGSLPRDKITCNFTVSSFDLIVRDLSNKSYRLFRDNLEKDINVEKSKIMVKADKVIIKLAKKKTDYGGYEFWSKLTDKKSRKMESNLKNSDPQQSIMQLMKDMYDEGDDNMKKVIGETMMKQRNGELDRDMGSLGGRGLDDV